jgi:glutamate racemase
MRPIGVFDSGVGGLSVLRALRAELPAEHFVYIADSGHAPYGERDDTHVIDRAQRITQYLVTTRNIKALVVACNTATASAIHLLRNQYPDVPIIGIEPALKPAAAISKTHVIGVMATRGTLNSEKFAQLLATLHGQGTFVLQPCDGLADAIEQSDAIKIEALSTHLTRAMGTFGPDNGEMDTLVLGCTHYPFAAPLLQKLAGVNVTLIDGGMPVAKNTRRILEQRGELCKEPWQSNTHGEFFTTGKASILEAALVRWVGTHAVVNEFKL